ncbi:MULTISPECIES: AAA family ATPase [unclassified Coleofasciculus]|uniref:AAA family ATPase n=1 Tax=unclassified Coleofasciculus TaxID=2692782 RepID=UPI001882421B|nr:MULTISPECIES: ATP-binding protein [unclassified Coleofasciculus]MBE9125001.1 AAA family ATPase [Coleofasciculus sp. LEGE 07081]MBE9147679.1 AAA family ATPase [Coleofasciculus sp. LEGE 07092]
MLRDLTIQNYRCFNNFHIDGLAQVNLFVGMNNVGKTTLLEAVYLITNHGNPIYLFGVMINRGEVNIKDSNISTDSSLLKIKYKYPIYRLFYKNQTTEEKKIIIQSSSTKKIIIQVAEVHNAQFSSNNPTIDERDLDLETELSRKCLAVLYDNKSYNPFPISSDGFSHQNFYKKSILHLPSSSSESIWVTNELTEVRDLARLWDKIILTPKEDKVIEALQTLAPNIQRLSFTSNQNFYSDILLKVEGKTEPLPLSSMGEGMGRILNLAMAAVTVENGFLLVDEIETGLYYESQTDMWRLMLEIAQQLNIQIFATTHSWDCICAFQEALDELDDPSMGKLFRLSRKGEEIRPVEYDSEKLGVAVRQSIEVR